MRPLILTACLLILAEAHASAQCCADCNGDGRVAINELVASVAQALSDCGQGPRFVDNGDGTVTDTQTQLIWEQKRNLDYTMNDAEPHDADNMYTWSTGAPWKPTGTVFTDFLYALNGGTSADGVVTSGCFANHCDWRLPTIEELAGILDTTQGFCGGGTGPCIDPILGPMQMWQHSASTGADDPKTVWFVNFLVGRIYLEQNKGGLMFVRAVRGGP